MKKQIEIINSILQEVNTKKADFNKVKKQIRKYLKQNKDQDFIFNYIVSNKYLFYREGTSLKTIYHTPNLEYKLYDIKEYLKSFIALCWYLSNKIDDLHKYQIQLIRENYKGIENPRKEYQKALKLNRSVGKNYQSFTPYVDIYGILDQETLLCLFFDECETNESHNILTDTSDLILQVESFLTSYNVASEHNKDYRKYALSDHPFYSLLTFSYHLFLEKNT